MASTDYLRQRASQCCALARAGLEAGLAQALIELAEQYEAQVRMLGRRLH